MNTACATCGGPLPLSKGGHPRRYCSDPCQWRRARGTATCPTCSATFTRRSRVQVYCSKPCGASNGPESLLTEIPWVSCLHCRQWFIARRGRCTHNAQCRHLLTYKPTAAASVNCETCSTPVPYKGRGAPRRFCSRTCYQASPAFRAGRRAGKATRRARLAGARTEVFDPQEVFDRDHWTCHLCHRPILRSAAVPHPRAATLDHVIPLARGGEHSRANTACACFDCNARKGDRTLGPEQLRLLG